VPLPYPIHRRARVHDDLPKMVAVLDGVEVSYLLILSRDIGGNRNYLHKFGFCCWNPWFCYYSFRKVNFEIGPSL